MRVLLSLVALIFLVSCSGETMEEKIVSIWKVDKMKRNMGGGFQNMVINPKMEFEFEETGDVRIITHLGQTIRGTWSYSEEEKAIHVRAENEVKSFVVDSILNNMLYLTSADVKLHLKKEQK
ncbi:hypothetical protein GGR42_002150 [Saonia flava]|uniref:Lipocalin-like domain-containing protein n=1 Tax=Saonia flava TaxID=523696 RepID=A0A846QUH4_9FLAO|nr:hypothetical protein [Saonia flava]NJB71688.1 hypothetical protein [Saonia flava]